MYPKSGTIVRAHNGGDDLDINSFQKLGNKVYRQANFKKLDVFNKVFTCLLLVFSNPFF